ncbi:hypothetical protein LIER_05646 [Lithospermum erythrorhizon]|uniref:Uncharacterized protein n=1 Tax=Lithospermum erythrorhizon TaxID=34254 RepID=A0AAV3P625_LITER
MAWDACVERAAQDHARSRSVRNPSHHEYSCYTDNKESYSNEEVRNISVASIPQQKEQPQMPMIHSNLIVVAMQQQLDTFKKFMAITFLASIAPVVPTTRIPFSDRLDAFHLLPATDKKTKEMRENSLVAGHITTIAGGIHGGGDSRNARKKYARREVYGVVDLQVGTEAITFTNVDCQGLEMPMTITL